MVDNPHTQAGNPELETPTVSPCRQPYYDAVSLVFQGSENGHPPSTTESCTTSSYYTV